MGTDPRPETLEEFVTDCGDALVRYAWLLTRGDEATSQDLVQAALVKILDHGYDRIEHPRAFARKLIVRQHIDLGRHQQVRLRVLPRLAAAHPVVPDHGDTVAARDELLIALDDLTPRERAVIVLRYYEDVDDATIASSLGCTRSTVRSLARRGSTKLRSRLDDVASPSRRDSVTTEEAR